MKKEQGVDPGTGRTLDKRTFDQLRALVYEKSGIALGPQKEALVSARVGKRMRALGITTYENYLDHVMSDASGEEMVQLLDAISTNVTSFFRESTHFDLMASLLAEWKAKGQRRFRFWSAASSTGEEPYTMAMILCEALGLSADARILATDLSTRVLRHCQQGVYGAEKVKAVPPGLRDRYLSRMRSGANDAYEVRSELRSLVLFRRLNLVQMPYPLHGPLDIIFCRNVMIYFDAQLRQRLVGEFHRLLRPGGYLFVGHAESLTGILGKFRVCQPSVYMK